MDFFYRQDTDHDGRVTRREFIEGIIKSSKLLTDFLLNFTILCCTECMITIFDFIPYKLLSDTAVKRAATTKRYPVCINYSMCLEFPTSRLEMEAVADRFDVDGNGYIDYREFVMALRWPARVCSMLLSILNQ